MSYVREFIDTESGVKVCGLLLGNGGTAVPLLAILREIKRVREGRTGTPRFLEPRPGYVRILRTDQGYAHDDPMGWADLPLATLAVSMAEEDDIPNAVIERWGEGHATVLVRCPFCHGLHGHGIPEGHLVGEEHREADCGLGGYYIVEAERG